MKAAVLRAYGEPLHTEEVGLGALGEFSARVRVVASGVCPSDLHAAIGDVPFPLATVLGHERAGSRDRSWIDPPSRRRSA